MTTGRRRLAVLVIVAAIAAGGGYAGYTYSTRQQPDPGVVVLFGNIDIREADLAFNVGGRIEAMLAEEGDVVEKGQLLAKLEAGTYEAEVAAAKARVGAQRAALDRLLAGSRAEEIKRARADVKAIQASLKNARATLRRTEKLAQDKFAPLQKLDDDRARVRTLEAQLKAAEQTLSLAIQGPRDEDIAQARAQLQAEQPRWRWP